MVTFSQLPNEMVSQVWGNILEPEDVESFALVSKQVYAIGKSFVEEHNRLKKEYSYLETGHQARTRAPAFLLKEILLRPRVALYVTCLSIGRHVDDEWPIHRPILCPDDVMALFVEAIQRTGFVPLNEISNWITNLKEGNDDPILALLLMFLPNLDRVILVDAEYAGDLFLETIQRVAEAEKTLFLKRLTKVVIESGPNEGSLDLDCFKAFASLPLVQSIRFDYSGAVEDDNVINDTQYLEPSRYNITELAFTPSGIRPKTLLKILESINGLKKFSYVNPDKAYCPFEPILIRTALLAHAKHSLESLKILNTRIHDFELLGTLCKFTALKELETNVRLLIDHAEFDKVAPLLPVTIERLHLNIGNHSVQHEAPVPVLVEELVKAKSQLHLIPHLTTLELGTYSKMTTLLGIFAVLKEKCRAVAIELTITAIQR